MESENMRQPVRVRSVLTLSDFENLLKFSKPVRVTSDGRRNEMIVKTLFWTGVRCNELINLQKKDFDFVKRTMLVRRGKGDKDRLVPLLSSFFDDCKAYVEDLPSSDSFLFMGRGGRITRRGVRFIVQIVGERARLPFRLHPHLFRASIATHMINKRVSISCVQKFLGHTTISTTQVYLRQSVEDIRDGVESAFKELSHQEVIMESRCTSALERLKMRLVNGEINEEQYHKIKCLL